MRQTQVTVDSQSPRFVRLGLIEQIMALGGRGCFRQAEYVDQLRRMSTEQLRRELAAVATEQWSVVE